MIGLGKMLDKTKPRISYPAATFQTSSHGRLEHGMTFVAGVSRLFLKDFRELQLVSTLISQLQTPVVQDVYPAIL
jgi:hypothetical protein